MAQTPPSPPSPPPLPSPPPPQPSGLDLSGLEGLSLQQRKCIVVNRAIDARGMGRYQWCVWALCGGGYFIDLLWAQAFGLVLSPLQQELGFGDGRSGNIATSFNAGLTVGAFFWGFAADVIGRRWAFNLTCLVSSLFGLGLGASGDYTTFLILTALVGFGVGGNIPVDTAIVLEFIPRNRRILLACLSIFQPLGVIASSALAYAFIPRYSCAPNFAEKHPLPSCRVADGRGAECCSRADNMGWRYVLFATGGLSLAIFVLRFVVFQLKETPKYLICQGRDEEAIATLEHMFRRRRGRNGGGGGGGGGEQQSSCAVTKELFETIERDFCKEARRGGGSGGSGSQHLLSPVSSLTSSSSSSPTFSSSAAAGMSQKKPAGGLAAKLAARAAPYRSFFGSRSMARLTILVWLTYAMDFSGFTIAGFYLPRILALKNGAASVGLAHTYAAYVYTYAPGVLGVVLGGVLMSSGGGGGVRRRRRRLTLGRKWTMTLSSALMGASIFLLAAVDSVAKREGFFALEYFFQSMFNAVLYAWTPEAFPAAVRGAACGIASFWGRLFGIVSPLVAQSLYGAAARRSEGGDGVNVVLYLAGGVTLGCVVSTALLPTAVMESDDEKS